MLYLEFYGKSSLCIAVLYLFYILLLQKETFFGSIRYFYLLGLLLSVVIPFVYVYQYVEFETYFSIKGMTMNIEKNTSFEKEFDWFFWGGIAYFIGVLIFIFKFLIELLSVFVFLSKCNTIEKDSFTFVETNKDITPFSFFKYIVYNPSGFSEKEIKVIINHEKAHATGFHSIDILLMQLFKIVFWFNPFVWLYEKALVQNLEFLADKTALNKTSDSQSYQKTLLKANSYNYSCLTNNFYNSLIKKRIIMLNKTKSSTNKLWRYILLIPVFIIFVFGLNQKTIAQTKKNKTEINYSGSNIIVFGFKSDFDTKDINNLKTSMKKHGLKLEIKEIERSSEGLINFIRLTISSPVMTANYNSSITGDLAIKYAEEAGTVAVYSGESISEMVPPPPHIYVKRGDHSSVPPPPPPHIKKGKYGSVPPPPPHKDEYTVKYTTKVELKLTKQERKEVNAELKKVRKEKRKAVKELAKVRAELKKVRLEKKKIDAKLKKEKK